MSRISKRPEIFETELLSVENLTDTMLEVHYSIPKDFDFTPGQFVNIFVTHPHRRAFSIAGKGDGYISFIIELLDPKLNGVATEYFRNIEAGAKTKMMGPLGRFGLQATDYRKVFIATGSGIAPFLPMIFELNKKEESETELFFGTRFLDDDFVTKRINQLKTRYTLCLSKEEREDAFYGRVTDALKESNLDFENSEFYICGGTNMISDVESLLKEKGASKIYFERYY